MKVNVDIFWKILKQKCEAYKLIKSLTFILLCII